MKAKSGSFNAWLKTLPLALSLPPTVQILYWGVSQWRGMDQLNQFEFKGTAIVLGITVLVHFLAHVMTGLPIFLLRYRHANSPIWMSDIGISLGAVFGAVVVFFIFGIFDQRNLFEPIPYLIGAGYGIATAIAALRQRPTAA